MKQELLNGGYVELVDHWGSDQGIIEAARMSTQKGFVGWGKDHSENCLWRVTRDAPCGCGAAVEPGDEKLLAYLYNNAHMTPFEMAGMTIEVKAPIMVFREWHRHRTQSFNEMSARYVPLPDENYLPDVDDLLERSQIAANTANRQSSGSGTVILRNDADSWLKALDWYYKTGESLYKDGLALGVPKELARLPVTVGRYSRMRASANLRNWLGFLKLRQSPHAQKEIRLYANCVATLIADKFPRTHLLFTKQG